MESWDRWIGDAEEVVAVSATRSGMRLMKSIVWVGEGGVRIGMIERWAAQVGWWGWYYT